MVQPILSCLLTQVIVEKMIDYLRSTTDKVQKSDVVKRLGELAERFCTRHTMVYRDHEQG